MLRELLEVVLKVLLGILITSFNITDGDVGAVENGNVSTAEIALRRHQVSEVDLGVTSNDSGDILVVIVEVTERFMSLVKLVSIFILGVFHGPRVDLDDFIEAHDDINNHILILEALLTALQNGLAHVKVGEGSTVDKVVGADLGGRKNKWDRCR